jgi:hypothetical protein
VVVAADKVTLDGFTINGGNATGGVDPNYVGGGTYCISASVAVRNCKYQGNKAKSGGAMYCGLAWPTITNCTFVENEAVADGDSAGAIQMYESSSVIANCIFNKNKSVEYGGAIVNIAASLCLQNCTFEGNLAVEGGAIYQIMAASQTVTNCILWGNEASSVGDQIYNDDAMAGVFGIGTCSSKIGYSDIEDCGGSGSGWDPNLGTDEGGNKDSDPCFVNRFEFSDKTTGAGTQTTIKVADANLYDVNDAIEYDDDAVPRTVTDINTVTDIVTFANDALDSNSISGKWVFNWGPGVSDVNEDYHLFGANSPCFNAGDPNGDYAGQVDIDGDNRVMDSNVDMGADEIGCMSYDHADYDDWVEWGKPDCWCYLRQCRGDADGQKEESLYWVYNLDLTIFQAAFAKTEENMPAGGICADFAHDIQYGAYRVMTSDLAIFAQYYEEEDPNVPECDGDYMNFWVEP